MYGKVRINRRVLYDKTKVYLLIFILLITIILVLILKTNFFSIQKIIIFNNTQVTDEEVISYSGIYKGQNIFKLKISDITRKINKHPFIKDVKIKRSYPNEILIDIEERKKLVTISHMGIFFQVDNEGYILKTDSQVNDEMLIEGFEIDSFIEGNKINIKDNLALERALRLSTLIREWDIDIAPKILYENNTISLYINDNFRVKFGDVEDIDKKFKNFLDIYDDLKGKNIYNGIIDLSHNGYPIYRPFGE